MNLYFMRHGIAMAKNHPSVTDDARRPLSPKGIKRTRKIARGIRRLGISFDVLLTSPLTRARQTVDIVGAEIGAQARIEEIASLAPDSTIDRLIADLAHFQERKDLLLAGHEPFLSGALSSLLAGPSAPRLSFEFKKGALCRIEVASLPPLAPARLHWFLTPKQLRWLGAQPVDQ
jgi:phosphohistidine phosphatase